MEDDGMKRTFDTGATRDTSQDKLDFEGFLSPLVIKRFGEYNRATARCGIATTGRRESRQTNT